MADFDVTLTDTDEPVIEITDCEVISQSIDSDLLDVVLTDPAAIEIELAEAIALEIELNAGPMGPKGDKGEPGEGSIDGGGAWRVTNCHLDGGLYNSNNVYLVDAGNASNAGSFLIDGGTL